MTLSGNRKILFVDLDGTLVLDNSFHAFLWSMIKLGDVKLRARLTLVVILRLIRPGYGRVRMKRDVLRAFSQTAHNTQESVISNTLAMMDRAKSEPVLARIEMCRLTGWIVVLATAAPECYARPFAESLGLHDCLASPAIVDRTEWAELFGQQKARACTRWLDENCGDQVQDIAVITDHADDLPLLNLARAVVLQAPPDDVARIRKTLPPATAVELIDPIGPEEDGGIWLWINDGPSGPHDVWEVATILSKHRYALLYRGEARWDRVVTRHDLAEAVRRKHCPRPPKPMDRLSIGLRRLVVRDLLGVYH